jgi:hypothetical protein
MQKDYKLINYEEVFIDNTDDEKSDIDEVYVKELRKIGTPQDIFEYINYMLEEYGDVY